MSYHLNQNTSEWDTVNNYSDTTGVNWDCSQKTGMDGHPSRSLGLKSFTSGNYIQ